MFASERKNKIEQLLLEYGKVEVNNLSEILAVSEVTIRKDLEKLEHEGYLIRTHGGAVLREDSPSEEKLSESNILNLESKKKIGMFAAALIQDRDVVFLGPGSTCLQIAKNLKDTKDIIVITNNVSVMTELAYATNCRVLATGGELDPTEYGIMMTGDISLNNIKNLYINRVFITVDGISFKRGYTVRNELLARLYGHLKEFCDEVIVVADHTKFNVNSLSNIGKFSFADKLISDQLAPNDYIQHFFEHDIPFFTTYPLK